MHEDTALQALFLPFTNGLLAWPQRGGALLLNARDGWPLHQQATPGLVVDSDIKPDVEALQRAGLPVLGDNDQAQRPLVLVLPTRQREQARALYAQALERCADGGAVVASADNDSGAKSAERDFKQLAGMDGSLSKFHCRVFWTRKDSARIDAALLQQWRGADAPRMIANGRYLSRPGVFAWDRIDPASALLVEHLPTDLAGRGADLGAGWGYLAIEVLQHCAQVSALELYEADRRALQLAEHNLAPFASRAALQFHWHDVTGGLPERYDFIVSNPPFHAHDRADRPELGQRFIQAAAVALRPGGRLLLVANRHLPYEQVLREGFSAVQVVAQRDGFKVVLATKAAGRSR